jgi:hypothetical protein
MTQPDPASVAAEVACLERLSTDELRAEYRRYTGEEPRSRNRQWLFRRTAWAYQASVYGGLSEAAKRRLEELIPTAELALRTPPSFRPAGVPGPAPVRDPRIPKPGTVLLKHYKGRRLAIAVTEDGFEYEGSTYRSLSAVARAITGQRWNGPLFFGMTGKKGRAAK